MRIVNYLGIFSVLLLPIILSCRLDIQPKQERIKRMTLPKAIEAGRDELKRIGYPHWNDELIVKADDDNSIWKEHIASSPSVLENEEVRKMKLEEKKYWAIYYVPKRFNGTLVLGGDAFVFIDRFTGEVIGVILGE